MVSLARNGGASGAESVISGAIPVYADWNEDIYFYDPATGAAMDLTSLSFQFQFRTGGGEVSPVVTLSTSAGTLAIAADSGSVNSILRIAAPRGTFSSYLGDLVADLIATDASDDVTLYAHGIVSFTNNPVST